MFRSDADIKGKDPVRLEHAQVAQAFLDQRFGKTGDLCNILCFVRKEALFIQAMDQKPDGIPRLFRIIVRIQLREDLFVDIGYIPVTDVASALSVLRNIGACTVPFVYIRL